MLTTKLDMQSGDNKELILYKIDTGSDGNIMPWYVFKNCSHGLLKLNSQKLLIIKEN